MKKIFFLTIIFTISLMLGSCKNQTKDVDSPETQPTGSFEIDLLKDFGVQPTDQLPPPQDDETEFELNQKAAEQGIAEAQFNLGVFYQYGQGIPREYRSPNP